MGFVMNFSEEARKAEADKQLNSILSKKEEAESKIKKFENEINALSSEYRVKESRLKFLEETEKLCPVTISKFENTTPRRKV